MAYDNTIIFVVSATTIGVTLIWFIKKLYADKLIASLMFKFAAGYNKRMLGRKQRLFTDLESLKKDADKAGNRLKIVEIGAGAGANFKYFPDDCDVLVVEPNRHAEQYLKINNEKFPNIHVTGFHVGHAEDMHDIPSGSVDAVVCTLVLCSVRDVDQCLREILRILRPGGKFFYLEHIAAPQPWKRFVQHVLTIPWRFICDGCSLKRTTQTHIQHAGFKTVQKEEFEAKELLEPTLLFKGVPLMSYHLMGTATK